MIWSRETGAIRLSGADMRVLTDEPDGAELVARLLGNDYPAAHVPPLLSQRMMPLLMEQHRAYRPYLSDYVRLMKLSNDPSEYYHKYTVPKRDGSGKRTVFLVERQLKNVQRWILHEILEHLPVDEHACAYRPGVSLLDNAMPHVGHRVLVKMDICDFFGSTKYSAVYDVFRSVGYGASVCTMLSNLCCLDGALPQGSAASPALSNLCFRRCDRHITEYCEKRNITYTRYSDDMSFSGDFDPYALIAFMRKLLAAFDYTMNEEKTHIFKQGQRQSVTGIVVNEKPQTTKEYRKKLRQEFYYVEKHGLMGHYLHLTEDDPSRSVKGFLSYAAALGGRLGFALFVDPENTELQKYEKFFRQQQAAVVAELESGSWSCPITGNDIVLPQILQLEFAESKLVWRYCVTHRELHLEMRPPCSCSVMDWERICGRVSVGKDGRLALPGDFLSAAGDDEVILKADPQNVSDGFYVSFARCSRA